ncbi:MAG: hypothetical protein IH885_04450 [Myxococcales bacterium]|nr:hypothetical protein [Myxococcales bacterium]
MNKPKLAIQLDQLATQLEARAVELRLIAGNVEEAGNDARIEDVPPVRDVLESARTEAVRIVARGCPRCGGELFPSAG